MNQRAATFHFSPTPIMGGSGDYLEFPKDADPILRVIYQLRGVEGGSPPEMLEQGAPSTISSSAASNSDSGIGGRDTDALLPQVIVLHIFSSLKVLKEALDCSHLCCCPHLVVGAKIDQCCPVCYKFGKFSCWIHIPSTKDLLAQFAGPPSHQKPA